MAEHGDERCSVVYYCGGAEEAVCELYHDTSPPEDSVEAARKHPTLRRVYGNIRILLDEDRGGFSQVFVSSQAQDCLDRLEVYANSASTVVLVELSVDSHEGSPVRQSEQRASTFPFLRALSADIQGARYLRSVMPFALLWSDSPDSEPRMSAAIATSCISAGALDILHSPLDYEDLTRLVGHVKEAVRPPARLVGANMAQNLVDSIRDSCTSPKDATHRPDQTISLDRKRVVESAVGDWHFPAHDFDMDELTYAALIMLEHMLQAPELHSYVVPRAQLMSLLLATRRQYKHDREVHYHNWRHAVDVTQSLYYFLLDVGLCPQSHSDQKQPKQRNATERLLTPFDGLILLISAIGHDVGHPGVNNAFLVACTHPLAQMYNDKSVLENYHCAAYTQLLRRYWPSLSNTASSRLTLISNILATDMQRHFEYMTNLGELKRKVESSESDLSSWSEKDREQAREVMMALLMKAADISNVARPFSISAHWARILMNEFARQGELESELGIPTCLFGGPPDKEDALAAAQSQKGFMSLFGFPLFSGMTSIMPSVSCAIRELANNQEIWEQRIGQEKQRRASDGERVPLTFSSVTKEEVEEAKVRHHKSEPNAVPEYVPQTPTTPGKRHLVANSELSPSSHPADQQRSLAFLDAAAGVPRRSSAPFLPALTLPLSPGGNASRRSSKDVALDQLQQLSAYAHTNIGSAGSRRGSADASWQLHQSYPGSRRGSKEESLTTILVTSQGGQVPRGSPSSPARTPRPAGSPGRQSAKRQSAPPSQIQAAARNSIPSMSHTGSSAGATTTQPSPSTQHSSYASVDDRPASPAGHHHAMVAHEDPFLVPGVWPGDVDGTSSVVEAAPSPPSKSGSPRIIARKTSVDPEDASGHATLGKADQGVRESRSRSRLRGLKFWRRKRDVSGLDMGEREAPT